MRWDIDVFLLLAKNERGHEDERKLADDEWEERHGVKSQRAVAQIHPAEFLKKHRS